MFTDMVAAATILGLFITFATWINGRTIKRVVREEAKKTRDTLVDEGEKTRATLQGVLREVRQEGEKTREMLKRRQRKR